MTTSERFKSILQTKKQDHQVLLKTNYLVFVLFLFAKAKDCQTSHQAGTDQT